MFATYRQQRNVLLDFFPPQKFSDSSLVITFLLVKKIAISYSIKIEAFASVLNYELIRICSENGGDGGQEVIVLAFYSSYQSLNPAGYLI